MGFDDNNINFRHQVEHIFATNYVEHFEVDKAAAATKVGEKPHEKPVEEHDATGV